MYERPIGIGFSTLLAISKKFGTEQVDVDDYGRGGCESCDYGSIYGAHFAIYNPTIEVEEHDEDY